MFKPFDSETQKFRNDLSNKIGYFCKMAGSVDDNDKPSYYENMQTIWNEMLKNNKVPDNFDWTEFLNRFRNYKKSKGNWGDNDIYKPKITAECTNRIINNVIKNYLSI